MNEPAVPMLATAFGVAACGGSGGDGGNDPVVTPPAAWIVIQRNTLFRHVHFGRSTGMPRNLRSRCAGIQTEKTSDKKRRQAVQTWRREKMTSSRCVLTGNAQTRGAPTC